MAPCYAQSVIVRKPGGFSLPVPPGWKVRVAPGVKYSVAMGPSSNNFAPDPVVLNQTFHGGVKQYAQAVRGDMSDTKLLTQSPIVTKSGIAGYKLAYETVHKGG